MHILHICSHKWPIPSPAIFIPTIYGALRARSVSHCESDRAIYAIENIGLIILKRPLTHLNQWHVIHVTAPSFGCAVSGARTVLEYGATGDRPLLARNLNASATRERLVFIPMEMDSPR